MYGEGAVCEGKDTEYNPTYNILANDEAARTPTHQGTQRLPREIPDTPGAIHNSGIDNTPALSQNGCQVP